MARAARFIHPGSAHLVVQRGHNGQAIVLDDVDREVWRSILARCLPEHAVRLHAWALNDDHFKLLATPEKVQALGRLLQDLGRAYVAAFNRRHGRSGTLWDGRFRACVVQAGVYELDALRFVESSSPTAPEKPGLHTTTPTRWSSLGHHLGQASDPLVVDPPAYWALGNTPFEREAAYRVRLEPELTSGRVAQIQASLRQGRPWGDADFVRHLELDSGRSLSSRPRGRPKKVPLICP